VTLSIPDFSDLHMLVIGDAMLDEYWFGDTHRISPEAPVPIVKTRASERRPGGAANVALNLAVLGARVSLAGIVGEDSQGDDLIELLSRGGVHTEMLRAKSIRTPHKLRVLARNQQLIRLDGEEDLAAYAQQFNDRVVDQIRSCDVVVLSDYGKGTLSRVGDLISKCRQAGAPVLVDPKGADFQRYRGASVLTPNQAEFEAVVGPWDSETGFVDLGNALRTALDLEALLVTRGSKGMTLFQAGRPPVSLAAQAKEVFDVTGAGDTVIAAMAAGVGAGLDFEESAALSNLAAGIVISKIGVASVTRSELRFALHRHGRGGRGLVGIEELIEIVAEAKARGEKIVMTNGCFDILHAGHVSYLEEAKSLGDHLIVAVNDDASVTRLKGRSRPITPLDDRMAVLAGLAAVDWVVAFGEDTPESLIERILPDILVKGGDWAPEQIVGGESVLRNGGQVMALRFREGRSTTSLIEHIRDRIEIDRLDL
jgi:D-beta-D-heptose 7-phosphate kinase/D-beta-D-heptose 1-phosphate adenosyltransferase